MSPHHSQNMPVVCPVCQSDLQVTRLQCPSCGTEVAGNFGLTTLASLREPYASLIALFLQVRGNVKDMERALGLSYPTVRARLEEALAAAGFEREGDRESDEAVVAQERAVILDRVERGEMTAVEAGRALRSLK